MLQSNCLIIDDLQPAVGALSDVGKSIVRPGFENVRDAVLHFANQHHWTVIRHEDYAEWALGGTIKQWVVLDPLFRNDDARVIPWRVSRGHELGQYHSEPLPRQLLGCNDDPPAGFVDDAAATGGTLCAAAAVAMAHGPAVSAARLCAATDEARSRFRQRLHGLSVSVYVPGDWRIAHLRDGSVFLPFTGRRTIDAVIRDAPYEMEIRAPVMSSNRGLWAVLNIDRTVHSALEAATRDVVGRLSLRLEREPVVADIALLGRGMSAPKISTEPPRSQTPLRDVVDGLFPKPR